MLIKTFVYWALVHSLWQATKVDAALRNDGPEYHLELEKLLSDADVVLRMEIHGELSKALNNWLNGQDPENG